MKNLVLIRHAKSSWKDASLADFDRPLNHRGKRDAPMMAQRLLTRGLRPDLFLSSPAKRAIKTAKIIAKGIGFPKERIVRKKELYLAGPIDLISVIAAVPDEFETVFLVGHNPGLTQLASHLSGEWIENIPTCGILSIRFDIASWQDITVAKGKTVFFDFPKKLANP